MKKQYVLKTGGFYISYLLLDEKNPEFDFLDSLIFSTNIERALVLEEEKAKYLRSILYINGGIDCEIKEK